jgi:hypothetical protein
MAPMSQPPASSGASAAGSDVSGRPPGPAHHDPGPPDEEILDGELIDEFAAGESPELASSRALTAPTAALPAVQAAAAAATGFVAGAATLALVRRHNARRGARTVTGRSRREEGLSIVASRSFLVDIHLIGRPGE